MAGSGSVTSHGGSAALDSPSKVKVNWSWGIPMGESQAMFQHMTQSHGRHVARVDSPCVTLSCFDVSYLSCSFAAAAVLTAVRGAGPLPCRRNSWRVYAVTLSRNVTS